MTAYNQATRFSQQGNIERIIVVVRALLSGFSLLAIWNDPFEPARLADITYTVLSAYFVAALVMVVVVWTGPILTDRFKLATHAVDLSMFILINYVSEGPDSPFFVYFVFSLVCATVRWQWRGTLWTAVAAMAAIIAMSLDPKVLLSDPPFALDHLLVRLVYLGVVAALLGYLGMHELALRGELFKLAVWPRTVTTDVSASAREMLIHASYILDAPAMLLAWKDRREACLHLAFWAGGEISCTRESPALMDVLVDGSLAGKNFICPDVRDSQPLVMYNSASGLQMSRGNPLGAGLQSRFNIRSVLSVGLSGQSGIDGYVMAFNKSVVTPDDLMMGELIAGEVSTRLDHCSLYRQLKQTAAMDERVRLARDLHDGFLQSLTAAALQLEVVRHIVESDPKEARKSVEAIQRMILDEQRDLRSRILELKPGPQESGENGKDLEGRLHDLANRMTCQWGISADISFDRSSTGVPGSMAREIYFVIHEALINAARHAKASVVKACLSVQDKHARITVVDDGQGFPFQGRYDLATLDQMKRGPVTLKERIAAAGGSLTIESGCAGARLEILMPLRDREA